MSVRLQAKVRECELGLWPSMNAGHVCNEHRQLGGICGLQCCRNVERLPFAWSMTAASSPEPAPKDCA